MRWLGSLYRHACRALCHRSRAPFLKFARNAATRANIKRAQPLSRLGPPIRRPPRSLRAYDRTEGRAVSRVEPKNRVDPTTDGARQSAPANVQPLRLARPLRYQRKGEDGLLSTSWRVASHSLRAESSTARSARSFLKAASTASLNPRSQGFGDRRRALQMVLRDGGQRNPIRRQSSGVERR